MNGQRMHKRLWPRGASVLGLVLVLSGCATAPTEPRVVALPGNEKSLAQFHTDDEACRAAAAQQFEGPHAPGTDLQWHYDTVYVQCMYAKGERVPLIGGPQSYRWAEY